MRKFLRLLLLSLILLSVAMLSAVTAMRFAIHGREVSVPKLIGVTERQARQATTDNGLNLLIEERFYSATVPEGSVVSQVPEENVRVRRGSRVRVALSLGLPRSEVPNVVGQSLRAAGMNIQRRGLELATPAVTSLPGKEPDQVIAQSPPPNSGLTAPKIDVLVSAPQSARAYVMPNFAGKRLSDIKETIEKAGFKLAVSMQAIVPSAPAEPNPTQAPSVTPPQPTTAAGMAAAPPRKSEKNEVPPTAIVVRQRPLAGEKVIAGDEIWVEVSR